MFETRNSLKESVKITVFNFILIFIKRKSLSVNVRKFEHDFEKRIFFTRNPYFLNNNHIFI